MANQADLIRIPWRTNVPNLMLVSSFARFLSKIVVICPTIAGPRPWERKPEREREREKERERVHSEEEGSVESPGCGLVYGERLNKGAQQKHSCLQLVYLGRWRGLAHWVRDVAACLIAPHRTANLPHSLV